MYSMDLKMIVQELKESSLIDMRIKKIYQRNGEFRFKLYGDGREDLVIKPELCIFLTAYPKPAPKNPSGFAMFLRKKLQNLRILDLRQIDFDRISEIDLGRDTVMYHLIVEFFGEGNLILTDDTYTVLSTWKKHHKREIYVDNRYMFPENKDIFTDIALDEKDKEIVRVLAAEYNLGGPYAEEVCMLAGIDKNERAGDVDPAKIRDGITKLISMEKRVTVVDGSVYPYELSMFNNKEKTFYNSMNEAFDQIYGKKELLKEKLTKKGKIEKKMDKYKRMAASQKKAISRFEREIPQNKKIGDLIYLHYQEIEKILTALEKARETHTWDEIREKVKENPLIDSLSPKRTILNFEEKIAIEIPKTLPENAEIYYERSKTMKKKLEGAQKALHKSLEKIKSLKEGKAEITEPVVTKRRKREWYEKFRWCFSSEGLLILGGRDVKTNEILVKRYMESTDLYLHADIHGAPHIIIKNGRKASEKTIHEAAIFAASFSQAWKRGIAGLDVYWVHPEQVTKSPPSGEYLPTGAFFIQGEKNFIKNVSVSLAIGTFEDKPMCGPVSSVSANCEEYIELTQGDEKKETLAKKISAFLNYDNIDDIIQVLPSGGSEMSRDLRSF
jgi:predicted ribosome quality control (RQC) complex YloA/Tae2 family protein